MFEKLNISYAQTNPTVGDIVGNLNHIVEIVTKIVDNDPNVDLIVFPECCVTGYPIEDLVNRSKFVEYTKETIIKFLPQLNFKNVGIIIGAPWLVSDKYNGVVYNAALLIFEGEIKETYFKRELPNYGVFDEERTFTKDMRPAKTITFKGVKIGLMICQDLWGDKYGVQKVPLELSVDGAEIFIVINGSPFEIGKDWTRYKLANDLVTRYNIPLLYVNLVGGQDELVFDGNSFYVDKYGLKYIGRGFQEDYGPIHKKVTPYLGTELIYQALMLGLKDYMRKNGFKDVVLGLSGGVDSAIVATIAADAIGPENVLGVLLPSKYSSEGSISDAEMLAKNLGIETRILPIEESVNSLRKSSKVYTPENLTKLHLTDENLQARTRGVLLMVLSNFEGRLLLSTGNKSEVSVGYSTLYGDMNGGFNPLKDVYKTLVFDLCGWRNRNILDNSPIRKRDVIPQNIITKPPSAELSENQLDTDSLPPYNVLDSWLTDIIDNEMPLDQIKTSNREMLEKVFGMVKKAEYKRRQAAPGTKITVRLYGNDRRYPITNAYEENAK